MPCIRRRYHCSALYLAPELIGWSKALIGNKLDVLLSDGDYRRIRLAGFSVERSGVSVKIANVEAFNAEASMVGDWLEFGANALLLGDLRDDGLFIPVLDGMPVVWCELR